LSKRRGSFLRNCIRGRKRGKKAQPAEDRRKRRVLRKGIPSLIDQLKKCPKQSIIKPGSRCSFIKEGSDRVGTWGRKGIEKIPVAGLHRRGETKPSLTRRL